MSVSRNSADKNVRIFNLLDHFIKLFCEHSKSLLILLITVHVFPPSPGKVMTPWIKALAATLLHLHQKAQSMYNQLKSKVASER